MDLDAFFTSPRWKILEILAKKPSSPLEMAAELKTSVSYVSQQLKLLEAANLIAKEKTGSAEKGKPRTIYSISYEVLYLTALPKSHPFKKLIYLTDYHKLILRIWFIENPKIHYLLEKIYWKIEEDLKDIVLIAIDHAQVKPRLIIQTESKKIKAKIEPLLQENRALLDFSFHESKEMKQSSVDKLYIIYNSSVHKMGEKS